MAPGAGALAAGLLAGAPAQAGPSAAPSAAKAPAVVASLTAAPAPMGAPVIGLRSLSRSTAAPLAQGVSEPDVPIPPARSAAFPEEASAQPKPAETASLDSESVPLPPRRPKDLVALAAPIPAAAPVPLPAVSPAPAPAPLAAANPEPLPSPVRQASRQSKKAGVPAAPPESPSFFEKIFSMTKPLAPQASGPALAYAAPQTSLFGGVRSAVPGPAARYDRWTAIYDISARTVHMPNGQKLEAHSGLGDKLDDPRYVHVRMHGPTPPHIYDLSPREALFHGVEALRLNPVGGGGSHIYGRAGLLAHTYMLGPNGDSNGCVSFRDYAAFLQAYKNGEVKRLVVVARMD